MGGVTERSAWTAVERQRFEAAIGVHGHTVQGAAERLRELGSPGATPAAVSRWVSGATQQPQRRNLQAILEYTREARLPEAVVKPATGHPQDDDFDEIVRGIVRGMTGEPLLGPLQLQYLESFNKRLRKGVPLTDKEVDLHLHMLKVLGLEEL